MIGIAEEKKMLLLIKIMGLKISIVVMVTTMDMMTITNGDNDDDDNDDDDDDDDDDDGDEDDAIVGNAVFDKLALPSDGTGVDRLTLCLEHSHECRSRDHRFRCRAGFRCHFD
ncbi:hypothetical protein PoB_005541700 [Plakobranchus ocellatus]|uniref:C3H1-type domain-containing protein n=1 Tax=Plakobranchus ocellatus TaxID=259542 RepID=A0AAV4CC40_9GAST|nr:hypothetical protein PoB_005541700 [Plakobranchus ocellatus]